MRSLDTFNLPNPFSCTMAQPPTEMSTRNLPGSRGVKRGPHVRLTTVIFEPIVWKMWDSRSLTTLWAFSAYYGDSFTLTIFWNWYSKMFYTFTKESLLWVISNPAGGRLRTRRGRVVAQAVIRQLPTAAARVTAQVRSCRICGRQSGTGAGFLRVLRFPLSIIPPTAPRWSSSIIRGWYNMPNSGRNTK
jgi:hypothetical protein